MDADLMQNNVQMAQTNEETDKTCPACGGVMEFNPASGKLHCPYCDSEYTIEDTQAKFEAKELDFHTAQEMASCDWGVSTKTVECKSCGAQTVYDVNVMSSECPYCGSKQVMENESKDIMAPGGVVPFQFNEKQASERFRSWLGKKFFCPKLAKDSARPEAFQGIYVPYWTFDANTRSDYTAEYGTERRYKDKDGNQKVEVTWHPTRGRILQFFDDVLVCASEKHSGSIISGLEPFDTKKVVEYKPQYMAGFKAERYSVRMKDAWEKAKEKIKSLLRQKIDAKIRTEKHTQHTRSIRFETAYADITYKYILLPVWISAFSYKGKVYRFMINGQTGKVSGQTPISWIKVTLVVIAVIAVIAAAYFLQN